MDQNKKYKIECVIKSLSIEKDGLLYELLPTSKYQCEIGGKKYIIALALNGDNGILLQEKDCVIVKTKLKDNIFANVLSAYHAANKSFFVHFNENNKGIMNIDFPDFKQVSFSLCSQ